MPGKCTSAFSISKGKVQIHQNIKTDPELFFELIFPYIDDIVIGVECVFCWYWLADLCAEHQIPFILGHALYMKAIHGGKTKNDKIDSYKIALLLKGGNFPPPIRIRQSGVPPETFYDAECISPDDAGNWLPISRIPTHNTICPALTKNCHENTIMKA